MVHEIVHAVRFNQNRCLAEGLAVYVSHLLCGADAWPFPGRKLSEIVSIHADRLVPLAELLAETNTEIHRFHPAATAFLQNRICYAQAGSFVAHLIGRHGWARFDTTYRACNVPHPDDGTVESGFLESYGSPMSELEQEWLCAHRLLMNQGPEAPER